ncbi:AAA family ATPase [Atlantibacter hermannii]|uniref:AAA family ATPase n=1 Tax=Atlantibacter hermannii TaxID=565 RepID=UPI00289BD068|nr:AAA family ATPase [Atlantibacter hermannii]
MKRFNVGLVVGKFSPLHLGHEALITIARSRCQHVILVSYSLPELPGCEADKRRRWLNTRFPDCRSLVVTPQQAESWGMTLPDNLEADSLHRHFTASLCLDILRCKPDAVFTAEDYGDGFAQVLSARFGKPVEHIRTQRLADFPAISGTLIRSDVHQYRHLLAAEVYADFVERICLLGGESTGKSTLTRALAAALNTAWVEEYGRERWEQKAGCLEYNDMLQIALTQIQREEQARPDRYLICDTSPLTTLFYAQHYFGHADPQLEALSHRPYSLVVLCEADFPFVQDGTRQDAAFQAMQQAWYLQTLSRRGIPFLRVNGPVVQRVNQIIEALRSPQ